MREHETGKVQAITDLNAPNGSRGIPFQRQDVSLMFIFHALSFELNFFFNQSFPLISKPLWYDIRSFKTFYLIVQEMRRHFFRSV